MTNLQWAIFEEYAEGQQRRISRWYTLEEAERKLAAIIHEEEGQFPQSQQPYLNCRVERRDPQ